MKNILFGFLLVGLFSCSKQIEILDLNYQPKNTPTEIQKFIYYGKTSYELKKPNNVINIDSFLSSFGLLKKDLADYGIAFVDLNNDGLEDVFYGEKSTGHYNTKPYIFINTGKSYKLDTTILPADYTGNENNRKTLIGDFNNDSLPDLFMINSGYEDFANKKWLGELPTLILSNKITHKYTYKTISDVGKSFWHGGASGDLNGDGNLDIIMVGGWPTNKVLYGDGKGNFTTTDWLYNAGRGYITAEIVDVDKDGQNDIILSGDEGNPPPGVYSKSTIFWNKNNDFSNQTIICEPDVTGWHMIMDIACEDIDGDGINEIILDRMSDFTSKVTWRGGYNITIYKQNKNAYVDVTDNFIKNGMFKDYQYGSMIYYMFLKKDSNGVLNLIGYNTSNSAMNKWKQNQTTKQFE